MFVFPLSSMFGSFSMVFFLSLVCCSLLKSTEYFLMVWLSLLYLSLRAESETLLPLLEESCWGDDAWGVFCVGYGAKEFRGDDMELRLLIRSVGFSGHISLFGMLVMVPEILMVGL